MELCHLQEWVKREHKKIVVIFEGRDAAGKGGVIKRLTEKVSPRVFRVVALPAPSDREKTQFYLQRYVTRLPAGGEVVIFDRSWYNRAGVERVMGFCTDEEYERFLGNCPLFERALVEQDILLVKYWLTVSDEEQERRFQARIEDPTKHWKLSPMDVEARARWYDYARARDAMLEATDTDHAPWHVVPSDDKRRARLNCIAHFLDVVPYKKQSREKIKLPDRDTSDEYDDQAALAGRRFVPQIH